MWTLLRFYGSFMKRKIGSRDGGVRALSSHKCAAFSFLAPSNISGLSFLQVLRFFSLHKIFNTLSWTRTIYIVFKSSFSCIQGKSLHLLSIYICMNLQTKTSIQFPYHSCRSSSEIGFSGLLFTCLLVPDLTLTWYISLVESKNKLYIFSEIRNWYMAFVFPWPWKACSICCCRSFPYKFRGKREVY